MTNYTPGATRRIPLNLLETAHKDAGKWLNRDDLEAWVFRRFAKLEAERDEWKAQAEGEAIVAGSYRDERDALAAHVERLCCGIDACIESDWSVPAEEALEMVRNEIPTESLARLKAQWQAEAVSQVAMDVRADYGHHTQYSVSLLACAIDGYANNLRRQAGGDV